MKRDATASQEGIQRKVGKTQFAEDNGVCGRTVTNWMQMGMPHLKISSRKILIEPAKADEWLRERFEVSRRPSTHVRRQPKAEVPA